MCQCTPCTHAMFEGKNIHYSSADNKPLCSFSSKICNQRRLNGYAFCVRHILEDYTAPFKRCSYVAKSSSQMCTQPIPKNEERKYCSNHMQVLGMLPKKERKQKKEKDNKNTNREAKLSFADRVKTKFNTKKSDHVPKPKTDNISVNVEDPYDPYAFSDPIAEAPCILSNSSSSSLPSPNTELVKSVPQSPGQPAPKPPSNEGTSSIAKLYPELAEKLEKIKPKAIEPKVKSRMRNSHNMKFNKLQTKIAQNRIKDKLRKSQETSHFGDGLHLVQSRSNLDVNQVTNSINNANNNNVDNMPASDVRLPMVPPPYNGGMVPPVVTPQHLLSYKTSNHTVDLPVPIQETHGLPPPPYPGVASVAGGKPFNMPMPALVVPGNEFEKQSVMKEVPLTPAPVVPVPCPSTSFNLPPPPPYVPPKPQKRPPSPVLPVLCGKPLRVKCVLLEKEAKKRLKKDSAVKYYSYHVRRKISNHILINQGICSSDEESEDEDVDMLPWQPNWFYPSSDDDNNDEELDDDFSDLRTTKLALLRSRLRRKCHQCRTATRSNSTVKKSNNQEVLALIQAAREHPPSSVTCLQEILRKQRKPVDKYKMRGLEKKRCCYRNESDVQCSNNVLPYTNHCLKHIMYNVDQQLFDYCTAKFADNTQCCVPIFDIKHELPLCHEHGAKADNYQKVQVTEVRKRPRKKTKPPALTRPPKKGKKKKKGRAVRPQKPIPPSSPIGDTSMPDAESDVTIGSETNLTSSTTTTTEEAVENVRVEKVEEPVVPSTSSTVNPTNNKDNNKIMDSNLGGVDLEETLGTVIDKNFELPLEQASRLLEEQDFQEVFNKIPDEAFDIFSSKNEPTAEETEELERALAAASSDIHAAKETLEQLVKGEISLDDIGEELTAILAQTLQANLQQEGNLPQTTADLTSESATTLARNATYNDLGLDVSNNIANNMAYARQVLPVHSASHANSLETTGNTLPHQVAPAPKYYPVNNGGAALSLPSQNLGTATRSYTVVPGAMPLPYQSNIPYTPLSQNIALPQQIGQQVQRGAIPANSLRVTNQLISQVHHPQQGVHVLSQQVRGVTGVARQGWTAPTNPPVPYPNTNGYPAPRAQFAQNVSATNPIGKFAVSAQSNPAGATSEVGNVVNKADTLYSQLNHSVNLSDVAVAGSSGQGFAHHPRNTNFSSFTSNTGS